MNKDLWRQPPGGPTITAKRLQERLGFKNRHSVDLLVKKGPEHGGLPGYVASGEAWVRKTEEDTQYRQGTDVMFYEEHVALFEKLHPARPFIKKARKYASQQDITTDEQMVREVLETAEEMRQPDGKVNRKALLSRLHEKYGPGRWNRWWYHAMKQILDDNGIQARIKQPDTRRSYKAS